MSRKPDNWYLQSGVIPIRMKKDELQILLIRSKKNKHWIIPKGIVEENMTPEVSALKEAYEEAGVKGSIISDKIGEYSFDKWEDTCIVKVYLMNVTEVLDEWPENFRKRKWFFSEEAVEKIENVELKQILKKFKITFNRKIAWK